MAKQKKKSVQLATRGFGVKTIPLKQFDTKLERAIDHIDDENWTAALRILLPLSQQYPQEQSVWEFLAVTGSESGNTKLYQEACEQLFAITASGEHGYVLGSIYLQNLHPLMALKTWRQALELDPEHEYAAKVRKTMKQLEPMEKEALATLGLTGPDGMDIAILHEQGQVYLETGDYAAARKAEETILNSRPDFISAHNNLSLISWMEHDVAGAIATAKSVLDMKPDNIHALSNLVHFLVISGNAEAAKPYGDRLKASHADAWDGWTKKLEGLTYLMDDAGVVEVWQQAQSAKVEASPASALFYHLAAVALARTGETKQAIAQWKKALARNPGLRIAKDNLNDIRQPIEQRHGAWPFSWEQWLMPAAMEQFRQMVGTKLKFKNVAKTVHAFKTFLNRHADVVAMLPNILERGGPNGQELFLSAVEQLKTPELLTIVKDFALSQSGTDKMRHQSARMAAEANLISRDKVALWIGGKQREIMLMAYTFYDEPTIRHPKAVNRFAEPAFALLQEGGKQQAIEAETLLRKALELMSDAPDLMNNLAMALYGQDREEEAGALIREIVERYPDYIFASASLARQYIQDGDLDEAEALLRPFFSRDRFHVMEFGTFIDAYIGLLVAKGEKDNVQPWLQMWEQVYPEDPQLGYWKSHLGGGFGLSKLFR